MLATFGLLQLRGYSEPVRPWCVTEHMNRTLKEKKGKKKKDGLRYAMARCRMTPRTEPHCVPRRWVEDQACFVIKPYGKQG